MFVPLAALAGCWLLMRRPRLVRHRIRLAAAAATIAIVTTLVMMASQSLLFKALPRTTSFSALAPTYIYDLAALSEHDGRNYFPKGVLPKDWRTVLTEGWNRDSMNALLRRPIPWPVPTAEVARMRHAWEQRIINEPLTYLRVRATLMADEISITSPSFEVYHEFIDPNPFGYSTSFVSINRVATNYMSLFTNTVNNGDFLFSVWFYLLICLIAALRLLKRGVSLRGLVFGLLGLASVTYQIGMFFGIPGDGYIYEISFVAAGLVIGIVGLAWFGASVFCLLRRVTCQRAHHVPLKWAKFHVDRLWHGAVAINESAVALYTPSASRSASLSGSTGTAA